MRESGPLKGDEGGDEEGDVDEDDHRGDRSPDGTLAPPRERGRGSPLVVPPPWPPPLGGERFSLWSLAFMVMMAPPASSSMVSSDGDPLRQGAGEGQD